MTPFDMSIRNRFFRVCLIVLGSVAVLLTGCASGGPMKEETGAVDRDTRAKTAGLSFDVGVKTAPAAAKAGGEAEKAETETVPRREPTLLAGTDRLINLPASKAVSISRGGAVSLKFEQAPVTDFVHAILGDLLKLDYTVHQPLGGEVTIHTQGAVPPDKVLSILESVLAANGLTLARDAQGLYHVGNPELLRGVGASAVNVRAIPAGQGMVVVPLQFVGATEMADILRPVAPAEAFVRVDTLRNLLILSGSRNQLEGWLDFVNIFDVDMLKGMSVGLFPLEYASAKELEAALRAVTGAPAAAAPAAPVARGENQQQAPLEIKQLPTFGPLGGVVRILPIERLNALLVVTPRAYYLQQAKEWIEKLDRPTEGGTEPQLYVYPVQNGSAQHLGGLLSAVFGGGQAGPARPPADSGVAPGLSSIGRTGLGGSGMMSQALSNVGRNDGSQTPATTQFSLGPLVRVVADEFNNALLIYGPGSEYRKIEAALRRLDLSPTQVLIEASILEVTLSDETRFGLQWFFEGKLGGDYRGSGLFTDRASETLGRTVPGFSYSITNAAGQVRAVLNAMAQKSLVNVISSPSVMVLDNHTAVIHVGDQQPIRSTQTVTDGGTTSTSIQYKDTGVMLQVTPSANAGGMVAMDIKQSVTDVGAVDDATGQRSFNQREVASKVAVRTGETVILGGLIRDSDTNGKTGVPWLHDIPVLGPLFGTTSDVTRRTELLVMITPRVVQSDQQVRELGIEMRRRMEGLSVLPGWERFEADPGTGKDVLPAPEETPAPVPAS